MSAEERYTVRPSNPKARMMRRLAVGRRRRLGVEFMPGEPSTIVFYDRPKKPAAFKMRFRKKRR